MNPWLLATLLGGAAFTVTRMAGYGGAPVPPSIPPPAMPIPKGWRRARPEELDDAAKEFAVAALQTKGEPGNIQIGAFADGRGLLALTEWHFHPPGGPVKPWGWHHGITLLVEDQAS